jgi:hypothetical protein
MPDAAQAVTQSPTPQSTEDRFESLWQAGAADSQNPKEAAQLRDERAQDPQQPAEAGSAPTPDATQTAPAPAEETVEYADLDDYLTKSGLDRDTFYSLPVVAKVDGQTKPVPLKELRDSWQQQAYLTQKSQAFAEQQRAWEAERTQAKTAMEQQLQQAKTLGDLAHQQLLSAYQGIDWNRLRAENPTEWAVLNQEFNNQAARIQGHLQQVAQQQQQLQQQAAQERAQQLPKEWERVLERVPEWRDQPKFQAAQTEMRQFGQQMGFKPEELNQIYDHRQLLALHYASQFLKLQSQAPQAMKRVQAAPKMVSPGARTSSDPKVAQLKQARDRLARNPRDENAQAAVFELLA